MKEGQTQRDKVATILRKWSGSDAARIASPNTIADEIDEVYREYIESLPQKTAAIIAGQNEWQRKVA